METIAWYRDYFALPPSAGAHVQKLPIPSRAA